MKQLWGKVRHKFMMWWSPAYRNRHMMEVFGKNFLDGFREGFTSGEPFTGFDEKTWAFLLRNRQLVLMGYEEGDEEE